MECKAENRLRSPAGMIKWKIAVCVKKCSLKYLCVMKSSIQMIWHDQSKRKENAIRGKMLKNICYKLEERHQAGLPELLAELEAEGISNTVFPGISKKNMETEGTGDSVTVLEEKKCVCDLLVTDDCQLAERAGTEGIACIGISGSGGYFDGAAMVLPDLLDADVQMLRECFCHFHGIPATIAKSSRLVLREIAEEDVKMLCRIGAEKGMEYAFWGSRKKAGFTPEVLRAYCKEQYRLYGYGLWGVFLKEDVCFPEENRDERDRGQQARLIGCCGFAEASGIGEWFLENAKNDSRYVSESGQAAGRYAGQEAAEWYGVHPEAPETGYGSGLQLELEYMLSGPYQHRGIGNEMCQMALQYAREYLKVETVWVQVYEKNAAGYALARKLGFYPVDDGRKYSGAGDAMLTSKYEKTFSEERINEVPCQAEGLTEKQVHWLVWKNKCG